MPTRNATPVVQRPQSVKTSGTAKATANARAPALANASTPAARSAAAPPVRAAVAGGVRKTTTGSGNTSRSSSPPKTTGSGNTSRSSSPPKTTGGGGGGGGPPPPPPPPPPAPAPSSVPRASTAVSAPAVAPVGPAGSLLVSLAIFNGHPFKDHWGFLVRKSKNTQEGIFLHAVGDVKNGFKLEIKRNVDFEETSRKPQLINLQWVDARHFNETMWNNRTYKVEKPGHPICPFEVSAAKAPVPARTLNAVDDMVPSSNPPRRLTQRNCQTWIIEAGEKLVDDDMFTQAVLNYLKAKKQ
ncbi:uncharacterized protein B0H64DRAFT_474396 [Chaetomium fimeti]|uniref:Uncharacterized protein n=1 Tax=Chaetomium fimeti TaxID=1854472 RepID=A0AAE0HF61_9PEZI|nr:hypothetical protein B0H64DRAFT_474396 [Chaetomium fimeti]